jgi:type II secretory pathway pseudopilin PulG
MNADTNKLLKKSFRQRGLTLIELAVVLLVLVGLAGLLLPYAGGFIGKTHHATSADAGNALASSLLQYQTLKGAYPQNLETLTSDTATLATDLDDSYWTTGNATGIPVNFKTLASTTNIQKSLQLAGIYKVAFNQAGKQDVNADGTPTNSINPTFATAILNQSVSLQTAFATDSSASGSEGLKIYNLFYPSASTLPAYKRVIVFGVGQDNSAVGVTLSSAPVYFSDKAVANENVTYGRFLAAFLVDTTGINTAPAQLIGIAHASDTTDGWQNLSSNIAGFAR